MAESSPATITVTDDPSATEQQDVIALVRRAAAVDGHHAVNEAGLLALQRSGAGRSATGPPDPTTRHVLARDTSSGDLVGYAQAVGTESDPWPPWSSTRAIGAEASVPACGGGSRRRPPPPCGCRRAGTSRGAGPGRGRGAATRPDAAGARPLPRRRPATDRPPRGSPSARSGRASTTGPGWASTPAPSPATRAGR